MSVSVVTASDTTFTIRVDDASPTVTYVGEAQTGTDESVAAWRIKKLTTTGTVLAIQWADGDSSFDNVWNNRTSYTYS